MTDEKTKTAKLWKIDTVERRQGALSLSISSVYNHHGQRVYTSNPEIERARAIDNATAWANRHKPEGALLQYSEDVSTRPPGEMPGGTKPMTAKPVDSYLLDRPGDLVNREQADKPAGEQPAGTWPNLDSGTDDPTSDPPAADWDGDGESDPVADVEHASEVMKGQMGYPAERTDHPTPAMQEAFADADAELDEAEADAELDPATPAELDEANE